MDPELFAHIWSVDNLPGLILVAVVVAIRIVWKLLVKK